MPNYKVITDTQISTQVGVLDAKEGTVISIEESATQLHVEAGALQLTEEEMTQPVAAPVEPTPPPEAPPAPPVDPPAAPVEPAAAAPTPEAAATPGWVGGHKV